MRGFRTRDLDLNLWLCYLLAVPLGRWLIFKASLSSFVIILPLYIPQRVSGVNIRLSLWLNQWKLSHSLKQQLWTSEMCALILYLCELSSLALVAKLCPTLATPWTVAWQAPLSMGFSRREYWSGLPFPSLWPFLLQHKNALSKTYLLEPREAGCVSTNKLLETTITVVEAIPIDESICGYKSILLECRCRTHSRKFKLSCIHYISLQIIKICDVNMDMKIVIRFEEIGY